MDIQDFYHSEQKVCSELKYNQGGCAWGKCDTCGVPFLLEKIRTGRVIDIPEKVNEYRETFFNRIDK